MCILCTTKPTQIYFIPNSDRMQYIHANYYHNENYILFAFCYSLFYFHKRVCYVHINVPYAQPYIRLMQLFRFITLLEIMLTEKRASQFYVGLYMLVYARHCVNKTYTRSIFCGISVFHNFNALRQKRSD